MRVEMDRLKRIKLSDIAVCLAMLFAWLGFLGYHISKNFGGVAYIAIAFFSFFLVLYPGHFCFDAEKRYIKKAFIAFCVFLAISFCGYEFFHVKENIHRFFVFDFSATGFNLFKNLPFWLSGFFLLLKTKKHKWMQTLLACILLYDVVVSLSAVIAIPEFAKNTAAGITTSAMVLYKKIGAMGYELTYSLAILAPAIFYCAYKKRSLFFLILAVLSVIYVFEASYLIALLSLLINALFIVVLTLFFSIKERSRVLSLLFAAALVSGIFFLLRGGGRRCRHFITSALRARGQPAVERTILSTRTLDIVW